MRSQAAASPAPPASARPCTAATTGLGCNRTAWRRAPKVRASSKEASTPRSVSRASSARSAPEQKSPPAPLRSTNRTCGSCAERASASARAPTNAPLRAFRLSGRFKTRCRMPSSPRSSRRTRGSSAAVTSNPLALSGCPRFEKRRALRASDHAQPCELPRYQEPQLQGEGVL